MESKTSTMCRLEKDINNIYEKYTKCRYCNIKRGLKGYYRNKDQISNERKKHFEKNRDKQLQELNDRYINFKELLRSYVELENRLKALDENFLENNRNYCMFVKIE